MTDRPPAPADRPPAPGGPGGEPAAAPLADLRPETRAIRAGRGADGTALAPLLWATTTFVTPDLDEARRMALSPTADRFYSRYGNPTVQAFEEAVASLEGAESARAFASGMGAVFAVVMGLCSPGDHIVSQRQLYGGTQVLLQTVCPRFGIDVTFVDATEPGAFAAAVVPGRTTLVLAETPANPRLDLVDLDELGAIRGPLTAVDATFAPPLLQRPLEHGVDLVIHSATKVLAGHNDASLGVVAGRAELVGWLWGFAVLQGANASPYDALNGLRGIRTLAVRVRQQGEAAQRLAQALEAHPRVAEVRYPGLPSHPQHDLARRQMAGFGGLVTFEVAGGVEAGRALVEALAVAQVATSLGGPETLVTHPASTTHVSLTPEEMAAVGIGPGTVRVSVGLEHVDDLVADFEQALDALPPAPADPPPDLPRTGPA